MKLSLNEWSLQIKQSKFRSIIPIMTHPGIELINASVFDAVTSGDTHFRAIEALHAKYPSAAVTMIMDLTVEAEAFGAQIVFENDDIPTVKHRLITSIEDVERLDIPEISKCKRLNEYLNAAEKAAQNINDVPVFSGCIGPFSLAGRLIDMSEIMVDIYLYPDLVHLLLEKCTSFIKDYIRAYKSKGINGVVIAEPAAGLLGEEDCNDFSTQYIKTIVDELQEDDFWIILHNCGHSGHLAGSMVSTGAKALHFGNAADMKSVLENVPHDILVMGNIDPVNVLKVGSPTFIKDTVKGLLELAEDFPNFIISSGCDMPPAVPHVNIEAFFEAVDEYNADKKTLLV